MMPLVFANPGETQVIVKVGGAPDVRQHLEDMGFHPGQQVIVISSRSGNLIVKVKESRVAISEELARRIMI